MMHLGQPPHRGSLVRLAFPVWEDFIRSGAIPDSTSHDQRACQPVVQSTMRMDHGVNRSADPKEQQHEGGSEKDAVDFSQQ